MMTSVTLPSASGPLHGVYSTSVAEETTCSEPEFEQPRPVKRCMVTPLSDSCKKRRKQATPVRISATESELTEGKPPSTPPESELQCPVCQLYFNNNEQLQNHIISDHSAVNCKKEPEDYPITSQVDSSETPLELTANRQDVPWMNDLQNKEWLNSNFHSLSFNPSNPMFMTLPQYPQPENLPRQPIRIFNPDAYCDLCNKEFCNKYFLKTHKANKHGIYTDPPLSESLVNNVNVPSFTTTGIIKLPATVPSVTDISNKNEISNNTKTPTTSNVLNPFSDVFPNPFSNKIFQKTDSQDNENNENVPNSNGFCSNVSESDKIFSSDEPAVDESPSPRNSQNESTSFKNESEGIYYIPQSKMSPSNDLDMSNRLRRIGVMNPKAFCEICCKEYCNKYFLRTHKMKRHGIYIPDDKDKDPKMDGSNLPWQNNMQTSPLNLIMTEQQNERKAANSPSDIICDICCIKFQNVSLFQLHNVSVHSKLYSKDEGEASTSEPDKLDDSIKKIDERPLNAEAISEDLQKLQTMILQLNELDMAKNCTTCSACNKEFENRYFLHTHMMSEHGVLLDDIDTEKPNDNIENTTNNNTMCDLCGKDVQNVDEMKKHLIDAHSNHQQQIDSNNRDDLNGFNQQDKNVRTSSSSGGGIGQISERRISMNVTPTSSYCDICNKELCNKYFMKTHMQRMHGIEIENGAQIGGVICDICNKELCSKYFLRVHKHNTHGIVEYGTSLLQPRKPDGDPTPQMPSEPDPALKPADLADLSHRYFTHFTEVCPICSRRFRSTKWLKAHLLSDHGQLGAEKWSELEQQLQQTIGQHSKSQSTSAITTIKVERSCSPTLKIPNGGQEIQPKVGIQNVLSSLFGVDESNAKTYQCSYCPFTTPLLPLLFVHERSHSIQSSESTPLRCPVCSQTFIQPELLQHHMFTQHPFLPLPPFFNGSNDNPGETSNEPSESAEEDKNEDATPTNICGNGKTKKPKITLKKRSDLIPAEIGESLKDLAKKTHMPALYALPQSEEMSGQGFAMQAFMIEETTPERRVVPAVVFLPVFQKQLAPLTVTFTLTPA